MLTKEGKRMGKTTGDILHDLRLKNKYTLDQVAKAIDCSASYLHRLEKNSRQNPSSKIVKRLAAFYQVDLSLLINENTEELVRIMMQTDFKESMAVELKLAVNNLKKAIECIDEDSEGAKNNLIEAQKSLLYIQSLR